MLKNPFDEQHDDDSAEQSQTVAPEQSTSELSDESAADDAVHDAVHDAFEANPAFDEPENSAFDFDDEKYTYVPQAKKVRLSKRDVEKELDDEQYHERLLELNNNAENKHYVLFFGQPASGKTWIIGSLLHYMKNYVGGNIYLDLEKSTDSEEELFYQLQNWFDKGIRYSEKITSTDTKQYFEFHLSFTPADPGKPPMDFIFVDASGEHSEQGFRLRDKGDSGKLPNYLTAILESNVDTKLIFVYDQSLSDEKGAIAQTNVLNAVFTHVQTIQNIQNKSFSKALLLSKADLIEANDKATVEKCGYDAMTYAKEKIPSFANGFFNESKDNKTIFYKMGKFSVNSDLLLEFDAECPAKVFRWLYMEGTGGTSPFKELSWWGRFIRWFKGEK